ncbi:MAG: UDP-N-acetylmuramoyl-L-alanyl-D-glutamate-2,6-diaminopimelate ligase [Candidatus Woesebacteria bacterium GW2011_GWA1_33_30]|uniref:UDP-N-acetylmuramoyl-L-alanyl-D-glutamate-2, 6-diaminopimelate ligase n=1 Tax=Candidatus Woesebacteria bacterium GW2011_GWA2_33_28 TaxID=1618561 RepID=A0A0G0C5X2_9BACT|nr:MAG: UDP-N-acetylmuramoyl-L-alanyl-D-glutamate-2,6-diaminopimelate ligase [Candidatus Woesebacteria bacterium GW2011_GWA2_33_28]KKP47536.1 MAG: UDP-N-acetylmuramoyl-L-alanyl-D-glutamate-2,6-diaminopimelate ligase [Candidatus Woesebacteria bacterium GW2011_GWA1_33_30]KKP49148.1 MAG: UDP-N-acetylmuramoyl-L-alanyl-D-glutamate-2,6-diaminopimelate ligase [Microgenomates group bacterium GW2011_GWC1_33_32]KKP51530.1 MAG: UDP-N-acetylmuramoyl-L-alanyl-D-glutamate-2,6-diaminopimelate ligase [Candidatu
MIQFDSKKVKKGDTFVAIKGLTVNGNDFIKDAIKNGAVKVYKDSTYEELGRLVKDYYKDPSSKLKIIGVTGTKGKTTTCHMIYHILKNLGKKVGLISTITTNGFHTTTPDVISLNQELLKMVKKGYEYAVLEVSSHGIVQGRIAGIKFDISVLTNIAPEHLDYHKTFEEYKRVKMMFVNSARYRVFSPRESKLNIIQGEFNNINAETAVEVAQELGISKEKALKTLKTFKLPSGRLEEIPTGKDFRVFVDFAHTPDSLEAVLKYLRTITTGRLISVFGCAGERDPRKRSKMGKISTKIAQFSIFTAEDPRTESVFDILKKMRSKAIKNKFICIPERGEAIAHALSIAKKGDIVGIFGKGHEKSMCYLNYEHPWNDQEFIKNLLSGYKNLSGIILAAGKGTRMKSNLPKVIHIICGRSMISYSLESLRNAGVINLLPVVGYKRHLVLRKISRNIDYAVQKKTSGTGDAVRIALRKISPDYKNILIINGDDSAFYGPNTIKNVIKTHIDNKSAITFVSLIQDNPTGLGRVLRDSKNQFMAIVEEKDASSDERKIKEVNDGLYIFNQTWLRKNISKLIKSAISKEYYLTDLLKIAVKQKQKVSIYKLPDSSEWQGINTPEQLLEAEQKMIKRLNEKI